MSEPVSAAEQAGTSSGRGGPSENDACVRTVSEQIVEIVSDSGEGAQTAGQLFGTAVGVFALSIPNRYLPILQRGRDDKTPEAAR